MIFICKSGVRSLYAANHMIENGYIDCYNITSGFNSDDKDSWVNSKIKWELK
jgi:rhodanese-related sulfurtransferase